MRFPSIFKTTGQVLIVGSFALVSLQMLSNNATAAPITDFDAGNIISDAVFYNKNAMSAAEIQSFLDKLVPNCDTLGTQPSGYQNLTNAQYAQQIMGWPGPPYVCVNKYHENPTTGETSYENGGGAFTGGISAAQIIYNAAQQYNINPQVLLVMLKKESAGPLTSDYWPLKSQYKYAMGYACPDSGVNYSAACDDSKAGFYKQMMLAAWQLNYYKEHPNDYRYGLGLNNIQYSPDPTCGTKQVNIQNIATLSLYIYTPYTPNDAALAAYPGQAPCGAYGNRNFFQFFKEWFGTTSYKLRPIRSSAPGSGVYLVENNTKRPFDSAEAMYSHGYSWEDVAIVTDEVIGSIPLGAPLGINMEVYNGKLIKGSKAGSGVYLVQSGAKRPFVSVEAFYSYGYSWKLVYTVTDAVLNGIPLGAQLGIKVSSYDLKPIRSSAAGSGVYLVESGAKRPFVSVEALYSHMYTWEKVIAVTDVTIASIPLGPPLGVNIEYYNLKPIRISAAGSGVYLVEGGKKHPFDSAEALYSYKLDWSNVLIVSSAFFDSLPLGNPISKKV